MEGSSATSGEPVSPGNIQSYAIMWTTCSQELALRSKKGLRVARFISRLFLV